MNLKLAILFLLITVNSLAQTLDQKIENAFSNLENDPQLKYGSVSLTVLNGDSGALIYSKNAQTGLAPASTLKTVTSATAFALLGRDFKWETVLGVNGAIVNGVLKGDLIVKGSGDPTLGSDRYQITNASLILERWVAVVKQVGIRKIEGRIVADDSLFGTQIVPQGWIWQDIGNYYGAGATSSTWRENEMGITFRPSAKVGEPAKVLSSFPEIAGLRIVNEVKTGSSGSGDNVYAYSAPYSNTIYLRGTYGIDLNKTVKISIPDPALQLAAELRNSLSKAGISSQEASTWRMSLANDQKIEALSKKLDVYQSPPLYQVIYWLNQKSLNLYAENILKTIAVKQGKTGSFEDGTEAIRNYWRVKIGLDPNSLSILDGSGLSPENRVTTGSVAKILQTAGKEIWFNDYLDSFPLYNNMKMKSGSIRNVLCYAGYQKSSTGIPLVFSIITNNYSGSTSSIKQKIFKVLDVLK